MPTKYDVVNGVREQLGILPKALAKVKAAQNPIPRSPDPVPVITFLQNPNQLNDNKFLGVDLTQFVELKYYDGTDPIADNVVMTATKNGVVYGGSTGITRIKGKGQFDVAYKVSDTRFNPPKITEKLGMIVNLVEQITLSTTTVDLPVKKLILRQSTQSGSNMTVELVGSSLVLSHSYPSADVDYVLSETVILFSDLPSVVDMPNLTFKVEAITDLNGTPYVTTEEITLANPNVVVLNTAPVITLVGGNETITIGDTYTDQGATALDTEDGNLTGSIVTTIEKQGVVVTSVDTTQAGTYTYKYNVSDNGTPPLSAPEVTRTVNIKALPDFVATAVTTGSPVTMTASCELDIDWGDGVVVNYPEAPNLSVTGTAVGTGIISIKGFNVTEFRFVTNEFTEIHIENNSKQVNASSMFKNLSKLTNFTVGADAFKNCTNFSQAWFNCSSLTSFPLLDTSSGTDFSFTWANCTSLTNFPLIDTSSGTDLGDAWYDCNSLTSFPLIDTSNAISFGTTWYNCSSLTSFPLIDTSSGLYFASTWNGCTSLTSFPLINTSSGTNFYSTWFNCSSLTSFPLLDTSSGTTFASTWDSCSSLVCLSGVNTELATNTTGMFLNTSLLVNPTPAEQLQIKDMGAGGLNYVNSNNCSPDFIATAVTTGLPVTMTASCELDIDWGDGILVNYPEAPNLSVTGTAVGTGIISIKGFNVTQFRFVTNEFTDIHIEENSKQVNATSMFHNLTKLTNFTVGADAFKNCIDLRYTWYGCSSLISFPLVDTSSGTNFGTTWYGCSSLTNFPLVDTSSGTNFGSTWAGCSSLTNFPLVDTSSGTNFSSTWRNCSALTDFPLIDTSSGTNFGSTWAGCSSLTNFPLLDTSSGTNFSQAWHNCTSLTSFPLIDTSNSTSFSYTWHSCSSLISFPLIDTSSSTDFSATWFNCISLTSFPLLDTSSGTNFSYTWNGCTSLTSFPLLDTSSGTGFSATWSNCTSLTSFPLLDTSSGTDFSYTWFNCTSLVCLSGVNTGSATSTTSMFSNTPLLVNPTPAEQLQIADTSSGGLNYVNSNNCPPVNIAPVITLLGNASETVAVGTSYTDQGATAFDAEDGDLTSSIVTTIEKQETIYSLYETLDTPFGMDISGVDLVADVLSFPNNNYVSHVLLDTQHNSNNEIIHRYDVTLQDGSIESYLVRHEESSSTSTVTSVDTTQAGTYTYKYNVSDTGTPPLPALEVSRTVNVEAVNTAPVLSLIGKPSTAVTVGASYTDAGATALDAEDGDLTSSIITIIEKQGVVVTSVDTTQAGTYTYRYNVSDNGTPSLPAQEVTRTVTVQ